MKIILSKWELVIALVTGGLRNISSIFAGHNSQNHCPDEGGNNWDRSIDGAAAEIAVGKALNRYWEPTVNNFHGTDGCGLQVRYTRRQSGSLLVRDADKDEDIFVLVVGEKRWFQLRGWMKGSEAKSAEFRKTPEQLSGMAAKGIPAYFVPQSRLHGMEELGQ